VGDIFAQLGVADEENAIQPIDFPLRVKTPYGYKQIKTIFRTDRQNPVTTYFRNNKTLTTSPDHLLKVNGAWKKVKDINPGDRIDTETGTTSILKRVASRKSKIMYDMSVEDVHCYYSNGILSHNSWILVRLGTEAVKRGKNVIHFTLELNQNYVGLRYDACFTGISFQDIRDNESTVREKILKPEHGWLVIKSYPSRSVSAQKLKLYIEQVQARKESLVDMVIVDYADLLLPLIVQKNTNTYIEAGSVYEELRTLAGELDVPLWSMSQTNRGSHEESVVKAQNVADSYRKVMTADFVFSLARNTENKNSSTANVHIIKNRFGADGMNFPTSFDASNGNIRLYEPSSGEGIEISKKIQKSEEGVKNKMREMYNGMKNKNWNSQRSEDQEDAAE
jgi:hypothetical protein